MGLDVDFWKREPVGYFRKINFFLTYFGIDDERDAEKTISSLNYSESCEG